MTYTRELYNTPQGQRYQLVDRERNFILRPTSYSREGEYSFIFFVDNHDVRFSGVCRESVHQESFALGKPSKLIMDWRFYSLHIPQDLHVPQATVISLIQEALEAYGWNYIPERAHSVKVIFKLDEGE